MRAGAGWTSHGAARAERGRTTVNRSRGRIAAGRTKAARPGRCARRTKAAGPGRRAKAARPGGCAGRTVAARRTVAATTRRENTRLLTHHVKLLFAKRVAKVAEGSG